MRFKDLLDFFPAPRRAIKHAYSAITLTRYTTLYFAALLLSTITLASLELSSHVTNRHADVTVSTIMHLASVQSNLIPIVSNQDGQGVLQLCNGIPSGSQDQRCQTVVAPTPVGTQTQLPANVGSSPSTTRQSSAAASTTPAQVPQEAQAPVSTTTASTFSTSTDNPGLLFAEQPTSTSSTSAFASPTGLVVAEIPDTTSSVLTTTKTRSLESITAVRTSDTVANAKATTQPNTETTTTTTTKTDTERTDTTSTSFSTVETTSSTSSREETETQSSTQSETTQTTTSKATSSTTSLEKERETEALSSVTLSTSSSSFESATSTTSNDRTSTLPTSTREPSRTSTSASGDAGIADVTSSEPSTASSLPVAVPTLQTSAAPETKTETTTSVESSSTSVSTTPVSDSTTSSASVSTSSERPTDQSRRRAVQQDRMVLRRSFEAVPVTNSTTGAILGLNVTDISGNGSNDVTFVDVRCAQALILVEEQLHESWTEDLVMVGYHIWLFGLGAMAILNESIPHLVAAFISSALALIWSGSQIAETRDFHSQFNTFITNGACNGADILPTYWSQRGKIDVAIFVLNSIAVLALGGLGSKLISVYRRQMTKVVGEERGVMRRLYKAVLLLSIVIQIGAFLLLASLALWVQQLFTSPIASFSSTTPAFKGVGLLSILLTMPWFIIGWIAIRREHKILMVIFLVMNGLFLASWVAVFSSDVYRLVFTKWTFFAAVTVATFFLLVGSLIAGVLCRMHFGMGLAVQLEETSKDEVDVTPWEFSNTAEKAWEPFERSSVRQSQFTAISSDRQSTAFSYGLKSPAPPVPPRRPTNLGRFSNTTQ